MDKFVHQQITSLIPAISIHRFSNGLCIFFARVTFFNVICSHLSLFFFNSCHCYLMIIICLLGGNIVILDSFSQLIQVLLAAPESSVLVSILHFLCKRTPILHNSTSVCHVKLQALLFCTFLLFSIRQPIDILV